jgi:deoxyribodipyrimidine photo-lyase
MLAALRALDEDLQAQGARLIIRRGRPLDVLRQLLAETGAESLTFNVDYGPYARRRDAAALANLPATAYDDLLLHAPGDVLNKAGRPYTIFTPFKQAWLALPKPAPQSSLARFTTAGLSSLPLPTLGELGHSLPLGFHLPDASAAAAQRRLVDFASGPLLDYAAGRNDLVGVGTSRLSPYLRFGQISIRQAYAAAEAARLDAPNAASRASAETWISELAWREFYFHILHFFPQVANRNFRPAFDRFPWRDASADLDAWRQGCTGYPIVDAAMRQLAQTGWMPNRARMIVASFLCKHLLLDWRPGERFFMQSLLDGDTAANNGGWQWSAGTGTDAQPYFRIFNPILQSRKFDPGGHYLRRWLPELRQLSAPYIHTPWAATSPPLHYPPPIVEHSAARQRALAALRTLRQP